MIPEKIIIHHSLTEDSGTVSWGAIRKYHIWTKGWRDIGYHAGVELVKSGGEINYEILMGRDWFTSGAHTLGENYRSLGFCFIGNYDKIPPTTELLLKGAELLRTWQRLFDIPTTSIYPHRDFAGYKSCPGKMFEMKDLLCLL